MIEGYLIKRKKIKLNITRYLLGEFLGKYRKIETIKTLNIYISANQAIIRSYMKHNSTSLFSSVQINKLIH